MDTENIIKSTKFLEAINKIDNLMTELLYSDKSGYIRLISKNAIENVNKYIENFKIKTRNIKEEYGFFELEHIIREKEKYFISQIKEHYDREVINWAREVFENLVENTILLGYVNKGSKKIQNDCLNKINEAIEWISKVSNYDKKEKEMLRKSVFERFFGEINKKENTTPQSKNPIEKDRELIRGIRNLIQNSKQ